ncbi:MAG TPA: hypothetical protein VFO72_00050 [Pyrinomonadaceae bacterium]|nr:hypothetical protein [Pyrinomonadaceae bacterium]
MLVSFSGCALLLIASACSQNQNVSTDTNTNETVVSSIPPFATREPERYSAKRTITTVTAAGETVVTKNSIARDGERRRDEHELASQRVVYLTLPEGRFLLLPEQRTYAESTIATPVQTPGNLEETDSSPDRLLHTEPIATSYRRMGAETIGGRATQKYRVIVNSSTDANVSVSESFIWIDEALHMPIRSETTSRDGKRVTMELSDIALDVDGNLFQIPDGYEKITILELRKRLKLIE